MSIKNLLKLLPIAIIVNNYQAIGMDASTYNNNDLQLDPNAIINTTNFNLDLGFNTTYNRNIAQYSNVINSNNKAEYSLKNIYEDISSSDEEGNKETPGGEFKNNNDAFHNVIETITETTEYPKLKNNTYKNNKIKFNKYKMHKNNKHYPNIDNKHYFEIEDTNWKNNNNNLNWKVQQRTDFNHVKKNLDAKPYIPKNQMLLDISNNYTYQNNTTNIDLLINKISSNCNTIGQLHQIAHNSQQNIYLYNQQLNIMRSLAQCNELMCNMLSMQINQLFNNNTIENNINQSASNNFDINNTKDGTKYVLQSIGIDQMKTNQIENENTILTQNSMDNKTKPNKIQQKPKNLAELLNSKSVEEEQEKNDNIMLSEQKIKSKRNKYNKKQHYKYNKTNKSDKSNQYYKKNNYKNTVNINNNSSRIPLNNSSENEYEFRTVVQKNGKTIYVKDEVQQNEPEVIYDNINNEYKTAINLINTPNDITKDVSLNNIKNIENNETINPKQIFNNDICINSETREKLEQTMLNTNNNYMKEHANEDTTEEEKEIKTNNNHNALNFGKLVYSKEEQLYVPEPEHNTQEENNKINNNTIQNQKLNILDNKDKKFHNKKKNKKNKNGNMTISNEKFDDIFEKISDEINKQNAINTQKERDNILLDKTTLLNNIRFTDSNNINGTNLHNNYVLLKLLNYWNNNIVKQFNNNIKQNNGSTPGNEQDVNYTDIKKILDTIYYIIEVQKLNNKIQQNKQWQLQALQLPKIKNNPDINNIIDTCLQKNYNTSWQNLIINCTSRSIENEITLSNDTNTALKKFQNNINSQIFSNINEYYESIVYNNNKFLKTINKTPFIRNFVARFLDANTLYYCNENNPEITIYYDTMAQHFENTLISTLDYVINKRNSNDENSKILFKLQYDAMKFAIDNSNKFLDCEFKRNKNFNIDMPFTNNQINNESEDVKFFKKIIEQLYECTKDIKNYEKGPVKKLFLDVIQYKINKLKNNQE
ncbi:MAG: hypothetical protein IJ848_01295 [Alphaproteobacteria bacterium]|nr:hypothetical protein [Alphaproteobacteria bacterium]